MILQAIHKAEKARERHQWDKTYWAIDLHETILVPNWTAGQIPTEFYPGAKEALQIMTDRKDICLFMFTCSHPEDTDAYETLFASHGIYFDYINENPEVTNTALGNYEKKPYYNVLLDDKAGFSPQRDWPEILRWLHATG
jgi:hypothetical protein